MAKNDRVSLYSELTKSEDDSCTLFEDILQNCFDEYVSVYSAMDKSGVINEINNIECSKSTNHCFEIKVFFDKKITDIDRLSTALNQNLVDAIGGKYDIEINKGDKKNTLLINILKKED